MFGSGRVALLNVREALSDVRERSGGPPGCPGVVGRPSLMSGSGRVALSDVREALLEVRKLHGGPPVCSGVVGRPSQLSGSGGRPSRMSGSCQETLPKDREVSPKVWEWSGHPPDVPEGWEEIPDVRPLSGVPPG